jgi:outer membrane protein TolC
LQKRPRHSRSPALRLVLAMFAWLCCGGAALGQVSLGSAIDLALRNSDQVKIAAAEQARAAAALSEMKDAYIPSLNFTSGLAKGTGFPPSDPSTVKLNAQGLVLNASQPQFIRAAREALHASDLALKNVQQQIVLDCALTYLELDSMDREIPVLKDEENAAAAMVRIMQARQNAGLESVLTGKKARLRAAQTRLKRLDLETRADVLRQHLVTLIGVPGLGLKTETASVPPFPPAPPNGVDEAAASASDLGVRGAYAAAKSKQYLAKGQHRITLHPEFDLLLQYGYLYDFNDYSQYYSHPLPPSNAVAGIAIIVPLFNRAQSAKAAEADAEAVKAVHEADLQESQLHEQIVQQHRAVEQTAAAADVAHLQHEISADTLEATRLRADQGGQANGATVTPADTAASTMEERGLLADSIAADFDHAKAELQWMRATGTLETWAKSALTAAQ